MITKPEDFQYNPYIKLDRGRVDFVLVGRNYIPNKEQAFKFDNCFLGGVSAAKDAISLLEKMLSRPKATLIFVNADEEQIELAWNLLCENTNLDVRFGTLGFNGVGLTFYK